MKVSIITTCYNREATLRGAIESVLEQDYPYIEYIVVDGASKDNSLAVINEYKNGIDKIISEPDKGMYEAINKGIRAATGDIIGLIHSDDFLFSSHTISEIVESFKKHNADLVYGNGVFVNYDNTNKMVRDWKSGEYDKKNIKEGWLPLHPTVYIKKECMERWGYYDESYKIAADSDLLVRYLYEADLKVFYLNNYIVKMRMGGLSTDSGKTKQKWGEDLRMYRSHGINPYWALKGKVLSKIPQFIKARLPWSEVPEAEQESLIRTYALNGE
jgi:glycosyltransferase involved in cell wall biosynthesis